MFSFVRVCSKTNNKKVWLDFEFFATADQTDNKVFKIQRALQSALIKMETQGSFLNGAEPSPPLPDATKEAEKEETREEEGGEEEQQQRVEEEDFPGEEEKKERSE